MDLLKAYEVLDVEPGKTFTIDRITCRAKERGMVCNVQREGIDAEIELQKISAIPNFNMCSMGKNQEKEDYISCI
jgi:hypothetical protein